MKLPISYFDTKMTGDLMQRMDDQRNIQNFLTGSTLNIIFSMFNLVVFSFVLAYYIDAPTVMTVRLEPGTWTFQAFIENAAIGLSIDTAGSEHYDFTKYGFGKRSTIKKYAESGSTSDSLYRQFQNTSSFKKYLKELTDLGRSLDNKMVNLDDEKRISQKIDSLNAKLKLSS
jgi:ABC-type multidrug transport system fused ATPase/permease subunit